MAEFLEKVGVVGGMEMDVCMRGVFRHCCMVLKYGESFSSLKCVLQVVLLLLGFNTLTFTPLTDPVIS